MAKQGDLNKVLQNLGNLKHTFIFWTKNSMFAQIMSL